jgi:hypothetical protein
MARYDLRVFEWKLLYGALIGLLWGDLLLAGAAPLGLTLASSFERTGGNTAPIQYVWRSPHVLAAFGKGGEVSILSEDGVSVHLSFGGADGGVEPAGENKSKRKTFYYVGDPGDWHVDENFERIRYPRIYPGIDLLFVTNSGQLEYNFEIAARADPSVIRIRYDGLRPSLVDGGSLEIGKGSLKIIQRRPQAFLHRGNQLLKIPCRYRLSGQEAFLELASYDRNSPLVIDPLLVFSTYLGAPGFDAIYGAAADASGNLYVAGGTSSGSLTNPAVPILPNPEVFVAKLNSTASELLYLVYLGGSGSAKGNAIAVDPSGNAYVTGVTSSPNFPVTPGALFTIAPGSQNAFVAKLNPTGVLQYATYLGASGPDSGLGIAVDGTGAAYVTGQTASPAFPTTSGAFQTVNHGGFSDCFVSKLNAAGSALVYSTLLGGSALDLCSGIGLDAPGEAYVTGTTYSFNFPLQAAMQTGLQGTANAFVAKINPAGSALVFSTYIGGSGIDNGNAVTVDVAGNAYVVGSTSSVDFPVSNSAWQSQLNGVYNAFALKMPPTGSTLIYSTFVGGSGSDSATSIAVDAEGRAVLGGFTNSFNFPVLGAYQSSFGGAFDAFSTVLNPAGSSVVYSSYFGGGGDDRAYSILTAPGNILYLAGMTASSNFPTASALQPNFGGDYDAFVAELAYISPPEPVYVSPNGGRTSSQNFAFAFTDPAGATDIQAIGILINNVYSDINGCFLYYSGGGSNLLYLLTNAGAMGSEIAIGTAGTLSNSQCSVNVGVSSAVLSGTTLTLNLALTFTPEFAGMKMIYMYVQNAGLNSGWIQTGTWVVTGAPSACEIGVDRGGLWYIDSNHDFQYDTGDSFYSFGDGLAGARPAVGPWHTPAPNWLGVFVNGTWYADTNGSNAYTAGDAIYSFGFAGAYPVIGDWTGSGVLRIGVFLNGVWYVDTNNDHIFDTGDQILSFGIAGDYPVLGDWTHTGTRKIGIYRGNGLWAVDTNGDNIFDTGDEYYNFGFTGAIPVVGDWTGNGQDKIGVFNPTNGNWYLDLNGNNVYDPGEGPFQFGLAGDLPVVICATYN